TLVVDGQSQSQVGGLFLWTAKAQAWLTGWDLCEEQSWVEAVHDGYQCLGVLHRRRVYAIKHSFWVIIDWLDGKGEHHIMQPWHTPAGAQVILNRKLNAVEIQVADVTLSLVPWNGIADTLHFYCGQSEPVIQGWVSTSYGHKEPAPAIVWERRLELPVQLVTVLWPASLADFDQELVQRLLASLPVLPKSSRG
ncbi:MAG: heparinase II/III-family protein, partial [Chloroflexi bacterium]|nr:heparinase II/III-family protein [Chloroflexota bacterium]